MPPHDPLRDPRTARALLIAFTVVSAAHLLAIAFGIHPCSTPPSRC
ncbi:hypothetical protein ACFQ2M_35085 [Kitasatospora saccharophila]